MFESVENNRKMILGAYRKLKSYYYYDKTILYNKISLAMWESDSHSFENRVNRLAKFMCTLENEIDYNYLTPLMRSIVLVPMPKAFEEPQTEDNGILIQNVVPQNSILSKVNFYIKTPVELLILDAIWMLMVGKLLISSRLYLLVPMQTGLNLISYIKMLIAFIAVLTLLLTVCLSRISNSTLPGGTMPLKKLNLDIKINRIVF